MNDGGRGGRFALLMVTAAPFFSVFPALGLILLGLSGSFVSLCIGKSTDALGLLKACRNWCFALCLLMVLGAALTIAVTVFSAKTLWKKPETRGMVKAALEMGGVILFLEAIVLGAMVFRGDVLTTITGAQADIQQIQSGELETVTVWIYPGSTTAHLPGPYGSGQPSPLVKYYASDSSLQSWDPDWFPVEMGCEPESTYRASKDRSWNAENVRQYTLSCTSRLKFVVEAIPCPMGPIAD